MTATVTELDALDPVPSRLTLSNGLEVEVEQLRTRQFFKMLRVITRGAGALFGEVDLFGESSDDFGARFLAVVVLAIPEAEEETIDFLNSMVRPVGLTDKPRTQAERDANEAKWAEVVEALDNPELEDTVSLLEVIVRREAADIQSLGKRLRSMLQVAEKTGQLPATSADSPKPSTRSRRSTAGQTKQSAT